MGTIVLTPIWCLFSVSGYWYTIISFFIDYIYIILAKCNKLERVKMFAALLVKELNHDDLFGIVTFGTRAKVVHELGKLVDHRRVSYF